MSRTVPDDKSRSEGRRQALLSLGEIRGTAKALALSVSAVGNLDDAAANLQAATDGLSPLADSLAGLL